MKSPQGRRLAGQLLRLACVVLAFALLNGALYVLLTRRLANNFSGTDQVHMIDVGAYLPHDPASLLPHMRSSIAIAQDDLPVLDGAAALVPVYAAVIDALYPEGSVTYEGGAFSDDNYYGANFAPDSKMQYRNTIRGFKALVEGTVDLFFTASPSQEQMEYAASRGVELACVPIGREAFVFFVNARNPVSALTSEQIRGIYEGAYRDWSQVGGTFSQPINPVTRIKGSGSQTVMEQFMGGHPFGRKSILALFGGSIGYSFRFYLSGMVANDRVKMLAVDGVYPDTGSIRDGSYPLTTEFYVFWRADNPCRGIAPVVDWLLSPEGQRLIEACGYVPVG